MQWALAVAAERSGYQLAGQPIPLELDKQRQAILTAARELLPDLRFEDLSVSAITERAGITRSGFYFYFDSKHAVLATLMEHCVVELEELTQDFAARSAGETPQAVVKRMLASTAAVFAHNRPVMTAGYLARGTDEQIRTVMDRLTGSVITQVQRHVADEASAGTASRSATISARWHACCPRPPNSFLPATPPLRKPSTGCRAPCGSSKSFGYMRFGHPR